MQIALNDGLRKTLISLIDLTLLDETLTKADALQKIKGLCKKAYINDYHVAAICVYPEYVSLVKQHLPDNRVKVATVANFPKGDQPLGVTLELMQSAIDNNANEIDVVMPYQSYLNGNSQYAQNYIQQCKQICGDDILLKVILETGAMTADQIQHAAKDMINAGADFLKTSTGKTKIGATLEATKILLETIKYASKKVGLKIAGGVRTITQVMEYLNLAQHIMGNTFIHSDRMRIGASQLLDTLLQQNFSGENNG